MKDLENLLSLSIPAALLKQAETEYGLPALRLKLEYFQSSTLTDDRLAMQGAQMQKIRR